MYRAPAGRVHAFVEHVGDGVTVEIGDAGPNGPLGRGGNVRLGDAPLPPLSIRARTHERLGRIFRVVVALDASGAGGIGAPSSTTRSTAITDPRSVASSTVSP